LLEFIEISLISIDSRIATAVKSSSRVLLCLRLPVTYWWLAYKPFQHVGCACVLGRVTWYPESCHWRK